MIEVKKVAVDYTPKGVIVTLTLADGEALAGYAPQPEHFKILAATINEATKIAVNALLRRYDREG